MKVVGVTRGDGPVILAMPHGGTDLPDAVFDRLNAKGQGLADTDWHIARLYEGLLADVTVVQCAVHRYMIDAGRDPSGQSLYPGQNTTGLCPVNDFDGDPIWREGQAPGADEIAERVATVHAPYHAALAAEVDRLRGTHDAVVVYDCHSIRSVLPFLFDGTLPQFCIGTNHGATCADAVTAAVTDPLPPEDTVLNGRFVGGWTTRHYGQPEVGVHAIQMELSQRGYMRERSPWAWDGIRAEALRHPLRLLLTNLDRLARSGALKNDLAKGA
ncbi:N-formylglutamate deformylase [Oceaniglobus roseus]|uniref:N-formylglutamate deformylase n=1 Tax=Oceaniglobus roseus TaxID=1737570 RepID=UPI000C7F3196|nr:N-formylglutamate deformylase [Kandeliimicrobium roseum]